MSIKIPTAKTDVTKEWLQQALNLKSHEVVDLHSIEEKDGFLSGVFQAQVVIEGQTQDLFIKIICEANDDYRSIYDTYNFDEVEIRFYKHYLPNLVEFERSRCQSTDLEDMAPKFYDGDYCLESEKRGFYLIMEDLSTNQYIMAGKGPAKSEGFTFEQINKILLKMARFHSLAYAFGLQGWQLA